MLFYLPTYTVTVGAVVEELRLQHAQHALTFCTNHVTLTSSKTVLCPFLGGCELAPISQAVRPEWHPSGRPGSG